MMRLLVTEPALWIIVEVAEGADGSSGFTIFALVGIYVDDLLVIGYSSGLVRSSGCGIQIGCEP